MSKSAKGDVKDIGQMATYTSHTGILEVIVPQTDSYFHFFPLHSSTMETQGTVLFPPQVGRKCFPDYYLC